MRCAALASAVLAQEHLLDPILCAALTPTVSRTWRLQVRSSSTGIASSTFTSSRASPTASPSRPSPSHDYCRDRRRLDRHHLDRCTPESLGCAGGWRQPGLRAVHATSVHAQLARACSQTTCSAGPRAAAPRVAGPSPAESCACVRPVRLSCPSVRPSSV